MEVPAPQALALCKCTPSSRLQGIQIGQSGKHTTGQRRQVVVVEVSDIHSQAAMPHALAAYSNASCVSPLNTSGGSDVSWLLWNVLQMQVFVHTGSAMQAEHGACS